MSGGEQQMCAIGRALMARPTLLMLDEPSMGLAPIFVERIFETIVEVNKQGTSILLVEQNALMALEVAARGYVLETGTVALADEAGALAKNEDVRKTYLGESDAPGVGPSCPEPSDTAYTAVRRWRRLRTRGGPRREHRQRRQHEVGRDRALARPSSATPGRARERSTRPARGNTAG